MTDAALGLGVELLIPERVEPPRVEAAPPVVLPPLSPCMVDDAEDLPAEPPIPARAALLADPLPPAPEPVLEALPAPMPVRPAPLALEPVRPEPLATDPLPAVLALAALALALAAAWARPVPMLPDLAA